MLGGFSAKLGRMSRIGREGVEVHSRPLLANVFIRRSAEFLLHPKPPCRRPGFAAVNLIGGGR
jgi:hypothetical protein